jgi:hypothetical protein
MHVSNVEAVRKMAADNWGHERSDMKDAIKKLDVPEAALLELVCRVNQIFNALAKYGHTNKPTDDEAPNPRPINAVVVPGIKVGDMLWHGCLDEGFYRHVVVHVDGEGYARMVMCFDGDEELETRHAWVSWLTDDFKELKDAVLAAAESDVEYHKPRLDYARKVKAAIERGEDPMKFVAGNKLDAEDDSDAEE